MNGQYEVGIAAGADASIPAEDRLKIRVAAGRKGAAMIAACHAYRRWNAGADATMIGLLVNAAAVIVEANILAVRTDAGVAINDGDWDAITDADLALITQADANATGALLSVQGMSNALSLIMATKINFWQTNHHTGQGAMSGYALKVFRHLYTEAVCNMQIGTRVLYRIGHWASTLKSLHALGFPEIRVIPDLWDDKIVVHIRSAMDATQRITSPPSGTAKTHLAYAGSKKLLGSMLIAYCPGAHEFADLPAQVARIKLHPTRYHTGAPYLTGNAHNRHGEEVATNALGRIGTYLRVTQPNGTLARSPHLTEEKVQSYPDYTESWNAVCTRFMMALIKPGDAIRFNIGSGAPIAVYNNLVAKFGMEADVQVQALINELGDDGEEEDAAL